MPGSAKTRTATPGRHRRPERERDGWPCDTACPECRATDSVMAPSELASEPGRRGPLVTIYECGKCGTEWIHDCRTLINRRGDGWVLISGHGGRVGRVLKVGAQ